MEWTVRWTIEVDAEYADEAAQRALEIMQDPASTAQYFHVIGENGETNYVDLYPYGLSTNHWPRALEES